MDIPVYVQDIASRSRISDDYTMKGMVPGYTIIVQKATSYTMVSSFKKELDRFVAWANRYNSSAEIISFPQKTHYCRQTAAVVVCDPVMRALEPLMK